MPSKHVVLIEPKSSHIHVYSFAPIPRLGAVLLGTILRNKGYKVDVFIEDLGDVDMDVIRQADLVAISLITATALRSYEWAAKIRAMGVPVVLGGPHVSFVPEEAIRYGDFTIQGEADETFPLFVDTFFEHGDLSTIPGLTHRVGGEIVENVKATRPTDLDKNPFADFSLVRAERLCRIASISTSRGCPFDCSFCSVTTFNGRGFRTHSVEHTLGEMDYQLKQNNFRHIFFADDIFNANPKRMAELLEGMIKRNLTPAWGAQMRHEVSKNEELVKLMKAANCVRAFVGFESINPKALKAYNKKETVEDIIRTVKVLHKHGVKVHGMFVVGCDEDSAETVNQTLEFCLEHRIDSVQFMVLTPLPGSRDYLQYKNGSRKLFSKKWELYDGHHVLHEPKGMSAYELQTESMKAMRRFYSLRNTARAIMHGEWANVAIRLIGWKFVRQWQKEPENVAWINMLRENLVGDARALAGADIPLTRTAKVAVMPDEELRGIKPVLEQFLLNLGAKVEQASESVGNRASDGRQRLTESAEHAMDHAREWFRNLTGRVNFVIAPPKFDVETCREKLQTDWKDLQAVVRAQVEDLPRVWHMPQEREEVRRWLVQVGLIFTDDLTRIRQACTHVLEQLDRNNLTEQPAQS